MIARTLTTGLVAAALLSACGESPKEFQAVPQQQPAPAPAPDVPDPGKSATVRTRTVQPGRLTFDGSVHDFGEVDDTRTLTREFAFRNETEAPIHVEELKASCGCTTTRLERRTFAPGEGDVIRIDWVPKGHGAQTQTVDVLTAEGPPLRLYVKARIRELLSVEPGAVDFGEIPLNEARSARLAVTAEGPVEVLEVRSQAEPILADFVPVGGTATGGRIGTLDVRLKPMSARGAFGSGIVLKLRRPPLDGEPERFWEKTVTVRAAVFGAVKLDPAAFYVSRVDPGGQVNYRVRVRRPDGKPFEVTALELTECTVPALEVVQVAGEDRAGAWRDLILKGPVGDYLGPLRGKVTLLTDVPGDRPLTLGVFGIVRPAAGG